MEVKDTVLLKMNQDDSALLYQTRTVNDPTFYDIPENLKQSFRNHYSQKQDRKQNEKTLQELENDENYFDITDPVLNNQKVRVVSQPVTGYSDGLIPLDQGGRWDFTDHELRKVRVRRHVYNVDSRDRDPILYPNANHFRIPLDVVYNNVSRIELVSSEFPNTERVIKGSNSQLQNNKIKWINAEDSNLVPPFPEYEVEITPGNYNVSTLTKEMRRQMNAIRRMNGTGKNHFFDFSINLDTDIVEVTSVDLKGLTPNPAVVTKDSDCVSLFFQDPPGTNPPSFQVGDQIFVQGFKGSIGGIPGSTINGYHTVKNTTLVGGPMSINDTNRTIDFFDTTLNFATLNKGVYDTPGDLATEIATRMTNAGNLVYTVTYAAGIFTISAPGGFELLLASGSNIGTSAGTTLGFPVTDTGVGLSHSGGLITNNTIQISVPLCAIFTDTAGSNAVRIGSPLPFMFKFGSNTNFTDNIVSSDTVSEVLGYPQTDSSTIIPGMVVNTSVIEIVNVSIGAQMSIETNVPHGLNIGDQVSVAGIVTTPSVTGTTNTFFQVSNVVSPTEFQIPFSIIRVNDEFENARVSTNKVTVTHTGHGLVNGDLVAVHFVPNVGGLSGNVINGTYRPILVVDPNTYTFFTEDIYPTESGSVTGNFRVSSSLNVSGMPSGALYGFSGSQNNTVDGTNIFRSVNLDGENYVFLTSPQLGTFSSTTTVNDRRIDVIDIFAKLKLIGKPGTLIFDSYATAPKIFDEASVTNLEFLEFNVVRQDGIPYDFYGLDYSFAIQITELIDFAAPTRYNTRRGTREIVDEA